MRTWRIAAPAMASACLCLAVVALAQDAKDEPVTDEVFVKKAASGGLFEVQSSQVAQQRSGDAEVKKFATQMITDHTKANNELTQAASAAGIAVPRTMMPKHQEMVEKLSGFRGAEFDREYWTSQDASHRESIQLFERGSRDLRDAQLKSFATRTLPVVRMHQEMVKQHIGQGQTKGQDPAKGQAPPR